MLTNPVRIMGDEEGRVRAITCTRMKLGEPDESGRPKPIKVEGADYDLEVDTVIMAIGTSPNPLIRTTTEGLEANNRGCLIVDENMMTTKQGVYAGGDAVTGAATVILAMGAGKKAAKAIDNFIQRK
jgi:glutamate synthase (NADPH/NADH) small chain